MDKIEEAQLNNIILNENVYCYENVDNIELSNNRIEQVFRDAAASSGRAGHYLFKKVNEIYELSGEEIKYSVCVFKYNTKPSFIEETMPNWIETKLAYFVIIDLGSYIVISKRNVSGIKEFIDLFVPLDYKVLLTLFVNDDTNYEKFALKNMNISDKAIREKTLEALDLKQNFSPLGANNYILNSVRVSNDNEKVSLSLNTSRINKFGKKSGIEPFIIWSRELIELINNHKEHKTFLSIFAEPQDYEKERDGLVPIAILFLFNKLYDDLESNRISDVIIDYDGTEKSFPIVKHLHKVERLCQVFEEDVEGEIRYFVKNPFASDLEIKFNTKSITLKSKKLSQIILKKDGGYKESIIDFLNHSNQFIINFDNVDLIYTNRKLFKDSMLIGNIEHFLKVFIPCVELEKISSEKGSFSKDSKSFSKGSVFEFVESKFTEEYDYFICDDLEKEWADHIGITSNKIAFFLSKYGESRYSASAFQDIVGQAQKNLGNISPVDYQIDSKSSFWSKKYKSNLRGNSVETQINRLRKGNSVKNAISQFKKTKLEPNLKREMYLVLNFISKSGLQEKLVQLADAEAFPERNEIIQILWFISSLISSCREVGVDVYICCKK